MGLLAFLFLQAAIPSGEHGHSAAREPTSVRLAKLIQAQPGLPICELMAQLGAGKGTVHYHLGRLEASGELHTVVAGRRRLVFPGQPGSMSAHAEGLSLLRGRTCRAIAQHVIRRPGSSLQDIVKAMDESPRTIYYHLKLLRAARLITSTSSTRYRNLMPSAHLEAVLRQASRVAPASLHADALELDLAE